MHIFSQFGYGKMGDSLFRSSIMWAQYTDIGERTSDYFFEMGGNLFVINET